MIAFETLKIVCKAIAMSRFSFPGLGFFKTKNAQALKNKALLAYRGCDEQGKEKNTIHRLSFSEATSGIVAFGATGSGKTVNVMAPALRALAQEGCPGLVLDVKGDYTEMLLHTCPSRVIVIGPSAQATPINLIGGISHELFSTLLGSLLVEGSSGSTFWGSSAVEDAVFLFQMIKHHEQRDPNMADISEGLSNPVGACKKMHEWIAQSVSPHPLQKLIDRRKVDKFSLINFDSKKNSNDSTTLEQYAWHTAHILPKLGPFTDNLSMRTALCAASAPNWGDLLYEQNKIIVFDMPSSMYGASSFVASKIVRLLVMATVLNDPRKDDPAKGFGENKFSFILADEYQEYVNATGVRGLIDDNTFFDRSRSFHHINIVATQGIASLDAQVGQQSTDAILQNLRTKIFLPTDDLRTLEKASVCTQIDARQYLPKPPSTWSGLLYAPLSLSPIAGDGMVLMGKAGNEFPHMQSDIKEKRAVRKWKPMPTPVEVSHSFVNNSSFNGQQRLFILTLKSSRAIADFLQGLRDGLDKFGAHSDEWRPMIDACEILTASKSKSTTDWTSLLDLISIRAKSEGFVANIALVRGGGDVKSEDFAPFNSKEMLEKCMEVIAKGNVNLMIGIAHTQDIFLINKAACLIGETPQGLGYRYSHWLSKNSPLNKKALAEFSKTTYRHENPSIINDLLQSLRIVYEPLSIDDKKDEENMNLLPSENKKDEADFDADLFLGAAFKLPGDEEVKRQKKIKDFRETLGNSEEKEASKLKKLEKPSENHLKELDIFSEIEEFDSLDEIDDFLSAFMTISKEEKKSAEKPSEINDPSVELVLTSEAKDEQIPNEKIKDKEGGLEVALMEKIEKDLDCLIESEFNHVDPEIFPDKSNSNFRNNKHVGTSERLSTDFQRKSVDYGGWIPKRIDGRLDLSMTIDHLNQAKNRIGDLIYISLKHGGSMGSEDVKALEKHVLHLVAVLAPMSFNLSEFDESDKNTPFRASLAAARLDFTRVKFELDELTERISSATNYAWKISRSITLEPSAIEVLTLASDHCYELINDQITKMPAYLETPKWTGINSALRATLTEFFPTWKHICLSSTSKLLLMKGVGEVTVERIIESIESCGLLHTLIRPSQMRKIDRLISTPKDHGAEIKLPRIFTGGIKDCVLFDGRYSNPVGDIGCTCKPTLKIGTKVSSFTSIGSIKWDD